MEVKVTSKSITIQPVLDISGAHAAGDQMSIAITIPEIALSSGGVFKIDTICVVDQAKNSQPFDILFFDAAPTIASALNAALDISDAEMVAKCIGRARLLAADFSTLANSSVATVNPGIKLKAANASVALANRDIFCVLQAQGTNTYTSASDLRIRLDVTQDF